MTNLQDLPEDCIAKILSHTTPVDACRLSLVSKTFRSAAEYDMVWEPFFPSDSSSIMSHSSTSKKALYFTLPDFRLTIIDNGKKSYQLSKKTGKKCYMFSALDLKIKSECGRWTMRRQRLRQSRFKKVVCRIPSACCSFSIECMINTGILSPNTKYTAFLVFQLIEDKSPSFDTEVGFSGGIGTARSTSDTFHARRIFDRRDIWSEIRIGSFNSGLKERQVPLKLKSITGYTNCEFLIEGIEFRPRQA